MDKCPCRFMSDGRWRLSAVLLPCPKHETDRRTSRPSTGGASLLRRDAGRRRSRQQLPDDGPPNATTEEQLKNNRIAHNERIAHHNRISNCSPQLAARAWGRRAASRCLGWPGRGAPPVRLSRTVDAYPAPGRGRRRSDAARLHIKLWRVVADIDPPRSDVDPLARSASRDAAEAHHGWNLSAPPICVHHLYGHAFC